MTPEQILAYIRNDKVKKVIHDGDFSAEIDDQFTSTYCIGSDKMEVLGVLASAYYEEPNAVNTEEVMLWSYEEIRKVFRILGIGEDEIPVFEGARSQISNNPDFAPSDSPAARFIIEKVKEMPDGEPLFVLVTGPCTNVVSACLIDPSIREKIVVLWLGGDNISDIPEENKPFHEWNLYADYAASQILLSSDIPLLMLPCGPDGSSDIRAVAADFDRIAGEGEGAELFRSEMPLRECRKKETYRTTWNKAMCDFAAPAALSVPDAMQYRIIPAPLMGEDHRYALDRTRRKILVGDRPSSQPIVDDAFAAISRVTDRKH